MKTRRAANERISALFKLDFPSKQGNLCLLGLLRAPSGVYSQGQAEQQQHILAVFHQGLSPTPVSKSIQAGKSQESTGPWGHCVSSVFVVLVNFLGVDLVRVWFVRKPGILFFRMLLLFILLGIF